MDVNAAVGFLRFFNDLPDRRAGNKIHRLHDLIVIAGMAVICGADGWAQMSAFGQAKQRWLATFLELPGGIPSHDTFGRLSARLDPAAFERCRLAWMSALVSSPAAGWRRAGRGSWTTPTGWARPSWRGGPAWPPGA